MVVPQLGRKKESALPLPAERLDEAPGDDLLLHGLSHTTIGATAFHFRVRDGIGWDHSANVTRELVRVAHTARTRHWDLGRNQALVFCLGRFVEERLPSMRKIASSRSNLELYDQAARIISIS